MSWREIQKNNFRDAKKIAAFLEIDPNLLTGSRFPLNVPMRLAKKMAKGDTNDPLYRQFLPAPEERQKALHFVDDPVEDASFCKTDKLLQKYEGRALLLTTSACAMHCRFCFRQNFSYAEKNLFQDELKAIAEDPSLHEIILSGGDPLSLSDRVLQTLFNQLAAIESVKTVRFHTRFPIGIPERIDVSFLDLLASFPKQIIFVLHTNHPKELDEDLLLVMKQVQKLGIPTLLQTVLLKGVNDNLATLHELFLCASQNGLIPYYLHQLDRVSGTAHFEVPPEKGKKLIDTLRKTLPGYAIPTYVQEIAGKASKSPL